MNEKKLTAKVLDELSRLHEAHELLWREQQAGSSDPGRAREWLDAAVALNSATHSALPALVALARKRLPTEDEQNALDWLTDTLDGEPGLPVLIPDSVYRDEIGPTKIKIEIDLPPTLAISEAVCRQHRGVVSGYLARAVRAMLIQSGHHGLTVPVSLIPKHPDDDEAARIVRDAAAQITKRAT